MTWVRAAALAVYGASMANAGDFDVRDQAEFHKVVPADAKVVRLAQGLKFTEGPAWYQGKLVFSDIPASRLYTWTPEGGVTLFREGTNHANGNSVDRVGRLITCEHGSRQVTRTEPDGSIKVLADRFDGKRLNSPNDLVEKSDGTIWFTDPPYGLPWPDFKGKEQAGNYVFRLDPANGKLTIVASDFDMPNGLCFSPDEKLLYIADSGKPHHIRVFDVHDNGTLGNGRIFCVINPGGPDGMRVDAQGCLYSTAGDGVHVFLPDGRLIGKILVPETPANCCFGGKDGHTLFMTCRTGLYSIQLHTQAPASLQK